LIRAKHVPATAWTRPSKFTLYLPDVEAAVAEPEAEEPDVEGASA